MALRSPTVVLEGEAHRPALGCVLHRPAIRGPLRQPQASAGAATDRKDMQGAPRAP